MVPSYSLTVANLLPSGTMRPTSPEKPLTPGDAVEVRFARADGFDEEELRVEDFWRQATVASVDDGVLGVVFADSTRMMVSPTEWRRSGSGR